MAKRIHVNNFGTTLTSAISNSATSIPVMSVTGLPTLSGGDYIIMTLDNGAGVYEEIKVTNTTNPMTAVRGQEGSTALAWASASIIEVRTTAASIDEKLAIVDEAYGFSTISVAGQSDVVADSTTDNLILVAGSNITLTTNAGTDSITISASSGGGGGGSPGGSNNQIQYNASGSFGGESGFTRSSNGNYSISTSLGVGNISINGNDITSSGSTLNLGGVQGVTVTGTTALTLPVGTTAQRPFAYLGSIRFNSSFNMLEYSDGYWGNFLLNDNQLGGSSSATGFVTRIGNISYANRTHTGTTNRIDITNGTGVSGNPTYDISSTYVGQTSITTLGTITTGVWNGSPIALAATVTTNANLTGPITSTGNATAVASQTGTGSKFVMDTSPTLVTPNLGTPSAAILTSATGLPLTTGVTGTLPVANGGTGRATSTTAYGIIAAGTTATGAQQTISPGAIGARLTSAGASALPVMKGGLTAFYVTRTANQTIGAGVSAKVQFNVVNFDTGGIFDPTTNYRLTPTIAGKYQINVALVYTSGFPAGGLTILSVYKNGNEIIQNLNNAPTPGSFVQGTLSALIDMNGSGDYLEIYTQNTDTSARTIFCNTGIFTYFSGFLAEPN